MCHANRRSTYIMLAVAAAAVAAVVVFDLSPVSPAIRFDRVASLVVIVAWV